MKVLSTITLFLLSIPLFAQMTCEELTEIIKDKGDSIETDYCLGDEALSQIEFYRLEITDDEYYFALVTFRSNTFKEYTYQITEDAMNEYTSDYFVDDIEKFWKYIQPYNSVLDCSPYKRRENKYSPR